MENEAHGAGLIRSKLSATVCLVATTYVAALSLRSAVWHLNRSATWLLIPNPFGFPKWAVIAENAAFYIWLLWLGFAFFCIARGKERIVVVGWWLGIALSPLAHLGSQTLADLIEYVKGAAIAAAFLAAITIFLDFFVMAKAQHESR